MNNKREFSYSVFAFVILLGALTYASSYFLMFVSGYLISKSSTRPYNILLVYVPIVLTRLFGILRPVLRYCQRLVSHNFVLKLTSSLRLKLYNKIEGSKLYNERKFQSGRILSILVEDISIIQNMYLRGFFSFSVAVVIYLVIGIGYSFFSPIYAILLLLIYGVIIFIIPTISYRLLKGIIIENKGISEELYNIIVDNILGIKDVIISNQGSNLNKIISDREISLRKNYKKLHNIKLVTEFISNLIFLFSILATIYVLRYHISLNDMNYVAAIILSIFVLSEVFIQLSELVLDIPNYTEAKSNIDNLDIKSENQTIVSKYDTNKSAILIENLSFQYDNKIIVKNLDLEIKNGEKICILGKSGIGKSTILKILQGELTSFNGNVRIFGEDLKKIDPIGSKLISTLSQDTWLFNTSLYNNIRMGNEEISYKRVNEIIDMVGLRNKVDSLENGLDTIVTEGGMNFSGGERQRLAIARILAIDTPIILLDEPTVGLDPITERLVLDTVLDNLKNKTILWISHHMQDIDRVDRVIYLKDGELIMNDEPLKLYKNNEYFRKLYLLDKGL